MTVYNKYVVEREMKKSGVAWFTFDEVNGDIFDSKGRNFGVNTNVARVEGVSGKALSFNGNSYVTFSSKIMPLGKKSIRFKVKKDSIPSASQIIYCDSINSGYHGSTIAISSIDGSISLQSDKGTSGTARFTIASKINICDGKWHDILITWDGTTNINGVKLYVDDMKAPHATTIALATETTTQRFNSIVGRYYDGTSYPSANYFIGQLDEFEIYNEVIDPIANKILLLSNEKTYSLQPKETVYKTKMTSNTSPSPMVASASSVANTGNLAYKAFNDSNSTTDAYDIWASLLNQTSGWLQLYFGSKKMFNAFKITSRAFIDNSKDYITASPKNFTMQGSNDGINFVDISEVFDETNWSANETRLFMIKNPNYYSYYRLNITTVNGGKYVFVALLEFLNVNSISEIPNHSEQNFIKYGASRIDNLEIIQLSKYYILQDTVSENEEGLWTTQLDRKPLSIGFN